jgi:hypothetical protein
VLVEKLIADPPVEALDSRVLVGLPRLDEMKIDLILGTPRQHFYAGEFSAVPGSETRLEAEFA